MAGSPQHITLAANTATLVSFDSDFDMVEVTNVDGAAPVYFVVDNPTDPTVAGTGTEVVTAGVGAFTQAAAGSPTHATTTVRLIAAAAVKVSVKAW